MVALGYTLKLSPGGWLFLLLLLFRDGDIDDCYFLRW